MIRRIFVGCVLITTWLCLRRRKMASYLCNKCEVAWPRFFEYRVCLGCGQMCHWNSDEPSLDIKSAAVVARQIEFDRKYNEREVERFRNEMEVALGPSQTVKRGKP
jgi:hypothetical protein